MRCVNVSFQFIVGEFDARGVGWSVVGLLLVHRRPNGSITTDFSDRLNSWFQIDEARFAFLTLGFVLVAYKILHMAYGSMHTALLDAPPALLRRLHAAGANSPHSDVSAGGGISGGLGAGAPSPRVAPFAGSVQMTVR